MSKLPPGQVRVRSSVLRRLAERDDPVFPAIKAHRATYRAYRRALGKQPDEKIDALYSVEHAAWKALLRIVPTTEIGAAALARHVSRYRQITCDASGWEIRSLLKTLRNVAACLEADRA